MFHAVKKIAMKLQNDNLDKKIIDLYNKAKDSKEIDIRQLKIGTKIIVFTKHSTYTIEILNDEGDVLVEGGTYKDGSCRYSKPIKACFHGSTWGSSMIWTNRIGLDMRMEFAEKDSNRIVTTSPVISAKLIGDSWSYDMWS